MADPVVRVRVVTVGGASINQTLRGATRAARQQGREQVRAAQTTDRAIMASAQARGRSEREAVQDALRAYRSGVRERIRGEREVLRAAQQTQRTIAREAQASARTQERAQRQAARSIAREQTAAQRRAASVATGRRRMMGGAMVGGVMGAVAGGRELFNTAESSLGLTDPLELMQSFAQLQRQLIRTGSEAGKSGEQIDGMMRSVLQISRTEQIDPAELVGGLAVAQESFSALDDFRSILPEIARASEASGSSVEELVQSAGALRNIFGLTRDEMRNLFADMYEQGKQGALGMRAQAEALPTFYSAFGSLTGRRGRRGALEGGAFAQVIARGSGLPPEKAGEIATMAERTITSLADPRVAQRLARRGVQIREGGRGNRAGRGALLNMEQIQANLASHATALERPGALNAIFGRRVEAHAGIRALINAQRAEPTLMGTLQNPSTAVGQRGIDLAAQRIHESAAGDMRRQQINRVVGSYEQAPATISTLAANSEALSALKTEFPILGAALGALTTTLTGFGAGAFVSRFLGTGAVFGAANAAGAGGTAAAAGGTAGAGLLATLGTVGAAGLGLLGVAGLGGYGLTQVGRASHNSALAGGMAVDPATERRRQMVASLATTPGHPTVSAADARGSALPPIDGREAARLMQEHIRAAIQSTPIRVEVASDSGTVRTPMQRRQPGGPSR